MRNPAMWFQGYPKGAIKTGEELTDLIVEARKGKKAIRLYQVGQSGHLSDFILTSKSAISRTDAISDIMAVCGMRKASGAGRRYYRSTICLGDVNINYKGRRGGHNRHMLFSNRRSASEYSATLQSDAEYQRAVRDWHRECDAIFRFGP